MPTCRGYFDSIPHAELMKSAARRISDGRMLRLMKMWLETPVEEIDDAGRHHRTTRNKDEGRGTPQGSPITPPTTLQRTLLGALLKRGGTDPIHDADLLLVDLDLLHQGPDDLPPRGPVRLLQLPGDAPGELLQLTDHQPQFLLAGGLVPPLPTLVLQFGQPLARRQDPRLEFRFVEQPLAVGIDQPRYHLFYIPDHVVEVLHLAAGPGLRPLRPPLVLRPDPLGLGQELSHVLPDGGVQDIGADLLVPAQALAAEAVGVGARAAVVGVGDLPLGRGPAHRLAVAAVAAPPADDQALEEIAAATGPLATAAPVLLELGPDRREELLAHQRGDLDEDLLLRGCIDPRDGAAGLLGAAALRRSRCGLRSPARVLPKPAVPS